MSKNRSESENVSEDAQKCEIGSKRKLHLLRNLFSKPLSTSEEDDTSSSATHSSYLWPSSNIEKQEPVPVGSESKSSSEEDKSSSDEEEQQEITTMEGCKQSQSPSTSKMQKGEIPAEVTEVSKAQYLDSMYQEPKNKYVKKFTFEDEKKLLQALLSCGKKKATKEFWKIAGDSLEFSIPVTQVQIYEKARRLKENYDNKTKSGNINHAMTQQEGELYGLSDMIWGTAVEVKNEEKEGGYEKKPRVEEPGAGGDHDQMFDNFLTALRKDYNNFPFELALNTVPAPERPGLEKEWKELTVSKLELFIKETDLILRIIKAGDLSSGK